MLQTVGRRVRRAWDGESLVIRLAALLTLLLALSTLQLDINGSASPYVTDVGEIQNALPRWGTLHFSGYPLYSLLGSLVVTLLQGVGIPPAAGASLFSALWGAAAIAVLAMLMLELGSSRLAALLGALLAAMMLSFWVDISVAEVHSMTLCLMLATLLTALHYCRSGARRDLLWLTLVFTQGVVHQRSVGFVAPAVALLIWPRWREIIKVHLWPVLGIALLAPLTYLYLPLRAWQGATWTFGQPGTWHGFWALFSDTKAGRIVAFPHDLGGWWQRARLLFSMLNQDLPWPLLLIGLGGILLPPLRRNGIGLALTVAWLSYLLLCLIIWEGQISDALLAAKLPIVLLAGAGTALCTTWLGQRIPRLRGVSCAALALAALALLIANRPQVLAITRDRNIEHVVQTVARTELASDRPTTLVAPWGHTYWALAYAQAFRDELPGLTIVDHNADVAAILAQGHHLLTLSDTLYRLPPTWWRSRLGGLYLSVVTPGVIEITASPNLDTTHIPLGAHAQLGNGVRILSAYISPLTNAGAEGEARLLMVYWQASQPVQRDYSVAIHILDRDPSAGQPAILGQADQRHPVEGWYPTSTWQPGEVVRDAYLLSAPSGTRPQSVRVGMYYQDEQGQFHNTAWLVLPWR